MNVVLHRLVALQHQLRSCIIPSSPSVQSLLVAVLQCCRCRCNDVLFISIGSLPACAGSWMNSWFAFSTAVIGWISDSPNWTLLPALGFVCLSKTSSIDHRELSCVLRYCRTHSLTASASLIRQNAQASEFYWLNRIPFIITHHTAIHLVWNWTEVSERGLFHLHKIYSVSTN